jgi:hypothetical protein
LTETRGATLFKALTPYLRPDDVVFDVCCGYSPLTPHLVEYGVKVVGIDVHPHPITELRVEYPDETWLCQRVEDRYDEPEAYPFTVLLLLGCDIPQGFPEFQRYLCSLVNVWRPHTVLMDTWMDANVKPSPFVSDPVKSWHKAYNCDLTNLFVMGYRVVDSGVYDADIELAVNERYYVILHDDC